MKALSFDELALLVNRMQKGDDTAFAPFYEATNNALYYQALSIVRSKALADDVVQETYINFLKSVKSIQDEKKVISYLNTIMHNVAVTKVKKESLQGDSFDDAAYSIADTKLTPDQQSLQNQESSDIQLALSQLDPRLSSVIMLRYYESMKFDDVAKTLNISKRSAQRYAQKGLEEMRKLLNKIKNSSFVTTLFVNPFLINAMKKDYQSTFDPQHRVDLYEKITNSLDKPIGVVSAGAIASAGKSATGIGALLAVNQKPLAAVIAIAVAGTTTGVLLNVPVNYSTVISPDTQAFTSSNITQTFSATGMVGIKEVRAYTEDGALYSNAFADQNFTLTYMNNGAYTVEVIGTNGHVTKYPFTITNIDKDRPIFDAVSEQGSSFVLTIQDPLSGVNMETLTITDSSGSPVSYQVDGSSITYSNEYQNVHVTVEDNVGNLASSDVVYVQD